MCCRFEKSCETIVHSRVCQLEKAVASFASDCQLMGDRPDILCPPSPLLSGGRVTLPAPLRGRRIRRRGFSPLSFFSDCNCTLKSICICLTISSKCVIFRYCQLLRPPTKCWTGILCSPPEEDEAYLQCAFSRESSSYLHISTLAAFVMSYFSIAECLAGDIFCPQHQTEEDEKARNGRGGYLGEAQLIAY